MGLSFTIAAGPRQRIHSRVRAPWDSLPCFTVSSQLSSLLPFCTDRVENTVSNSNSPLLRVYCLGSHVNATQSVHWGDGCYLATAVAPLFVLPYLPSNGSICHNAFTVEPDSYTYKLKRVMEMYIISEICIGRLFVVTI
jgi:hypothetical protein